MEQATIANHIKSLGKRDFDAIVTLILKHVFKLNAIDVNGAGDAGSDMRCFVTRREQRAWASTAIQKTVSDRSWKKKALEDAEKAVRDLGAHQYYFLTSRAHTSAELRSVEAEIQTECGIGATCLGANEIGGLIHDNDLVREFAEVINLPLDVPIRNRPDRQEMLLHAFAALSDERKELQHHVFDDALLVTLFESDGKITPAKLAEHASKLLGLTPESHQMLEKRIDSLLSRGRIVKLNAHLDLSDRDLLDLRASTGMYLQEFESLAGAQQQVLYDLGLVGWDRKRSEELAVLLSRYFVQHQLQIAERASLPLTKIAMSRTLGDPESEMLTILKNGGLELDQAKDAVRALVELASERPLIQKLSRAVTYIATEGRSIAQSCRALGAAKWTEVIVTLDASVAIPYLCSSLFAPTHGRFSIGSNECIRSLRKLHAQLVIPYFYINETAAHLLLALNTPDENEFAKAAEYSRNGFVSHYFRLRNRGVRVPPTLREFVGVFSETALKGNGDRRERARSIMPDIQALLRNYGVEFETIQAFDSRSSAYRAYRKPAEENFDHFLNERQRRRRRRLIDHDVNVLAYTRKQVLENGEPRMCLTWDRTMIDVSAELGDCGWVVTPSEASDLVQSSVDFSRTRLTSLAHALAKAAPPADQAGARLLDRVAELSSSKVQDWEFKQQFRDLYQSVMRRVTANVSSLDWPDTEVEEFFAQHDSETNQAEIDAPE